MSVAVAICGLLATGVAGYRWLRVSQREHYIAGSCLTTARRWITRRPLNAAVGLVAIVALVLGATVHIAAGLLAAAAAAVFPWPMPLKGNPPLRFTRRATTLATITAALAATVVLLVAVALDWAVGVVAGAVLVPAVVDLAAAIAAPIERRLLERHRAPAEARLRQVAPLVVAVTGSWGKTSTKNHIRDLMAGSVEVVASPASWNNTAGLSRTIHEHLTDTTDVLVAEMGTYGPGEIAEMCAWVRPRVGVICAIGPMHLERMRTIETIVAAKAEILDGVATAILWVDDPHLAALADQVAVRTGGPRVVRVGTHGSRTDLDLSVVVTSPSQTGQTDARVAGAQLPSSAEGAQIEVWAGDELIGAVPATGGPHPGNLGCAVAAALAAGARPADVASRLGSLSTPSHRATTGISDSGVLVMDDTFNSNPVGAHAAIERLASMVEGRRAVVTPGMVELGPIQDAENERLARAVTDSGATLIVVGWTNRSALIRGGGAEVVTVDDRDAARAWIRANLGPGDGVLWENDLPDHYP